MTTPALESKTYVKTEFTSWETVVLANSTTEMPEEETIAKSLTNSTLRSKKKSSKQE